MNNFHAQSQVRAENAPPALALLNAFAQESALNSFPAFCVAHWEWPQNEHFGFRCSNLLWFPPRTVSLTRENTIFLGCECITDLRLHLINCDRKGDRSEEARCISTRPHGHSAALHRKNLFALQWKPCRRNPVTHTLLLMQSCKVALGTAAANVTHAGMRDASWVCERKRDASFSVLIGGFPRLHPKHL